MSRRRPVLRCLAIVGMFLVSAVFAAPASAATWNFETLDGTGPVGDPNGRVDATVGESTASLVWGNEPHVWYADSTNGYIRHAWYSGTQWFFETLDGDCPTAVCADGSANANMGFFGISAAVYDGTPHIWYADDTNQRLRHGWWTGRSWQFEDLDGVGVPGGNGRVANVVGWYSNAVVWNNEPHVWYWDNSEFELRHAWWNGQAWFFETLDGDCPTALCADGSSNAQVGWYTSATVWDGTPHVWYHDFTNNDLRHAWWTGTEWRFETLDGNSTGPNGRINTTLGGFTSVTVFNNEPHVWYLDFANGDLRHAWWTGTSWFFETLDGNCPVAPCANGTVSTDVGQYTTVTLWDGVPHVWYQGYGGGTDDLRHAWYSGTQWFFETLDGASAGPNGRVPTGVGYWNDVLIWNNQLHVWNFEGFPEGNLRHAWYG